MLIRVIVSLHMVESVHTHLRAIVCECTRVWYEMHTGVVTSGHAFVVVNVHMYAHVDG